METPSASVPAPTVNLPPQATGGPTGSGPDPGPFPATLAAGGSNASIFEDIAYMMDRFEREAENFSRDTAFRPLFRLWSKLARFTSAQNGRKVLLWFSTGFRFRGGRFAQQHGDRKKLWRSNPADGQSAERCACGHVHH